MLGDGLPGHVESCRDIGDPLGASFSQQFDDTAPGRVGERCERIRLVWFGHVDTLRLKSN
jgi:hypothetical protein